MPFVLPQQNGPELKVELGRDVREENPNYKSEIYYQFREKTMFQVSEMPILVNFIFF